LSAFNWSPTGLDCDPCFDVETLTPTEQDYSTYTINACGESSEVVELTHQLHADGKYCSDYGAGNSGGYSTLQSCVEFVIGEGGEFFHYNKDYSECYVCASEVFNDSSAGTQVYQMVAAGPGGEAAGSGYDKQ
jgi:hypothetical protein